MNRPALLVGLILATPATRAANGGEVAPVSIENRVLRLEIQPSPAPHVGRLVHKASGQALVAQPAQKSLFAITLAKLDGGAEAIDSTRAGEATVRAEKTDGGGRLVIKYGKFPALDLAVEVAASFTPDDPLILWSMSIQNNTGRRIKAVRFPQLLAVPTIGEGKDDCLVLPALAGTLIENPAESWANGQSVTLTYPGNLSAQFLAYQDRAAGVYLAAMDSQGYPMALTVAKSPDGLRLGHEFAVVNDAPHAAENGANGEKHWQSPYPIALGVTQGTWCDSADQYKRWAVRQPWCAKTVAERDDIPAWWKAGPAVHVCEVRTYDNKRTCTGSYYPRLQEHLRTLRDKIDGPIVPMLAGWENHRRWTGGDYFPVFDAEQAQRVVPLLEQDDFRPFYFLSGLFFTYRNEGRDGAEIPAAQQYLASYVIDEKNGKAKEYVLNESNPAGDWKRHSYQFCVSPAQTRDFFCRVIDQAHAGGVDVLQMDQTTGGTGDVCYATTHGHPPGPGRYQSHAFWRLLEALRRHGKSLAADFVLFHEEPHEQLLPYLDGFHVREYYEKRWYRGYPGAVGIPLFCYLYHEYALGYGGDSAGLSKANDRWNVRCHAMNLVTGRTPGVAIWSSHQSVFEAHPDQLAVIRSHCRLLKTRAQQFLMLGTMLHPYELAVPQVAISVPAQRGGKWVREELPTAAILTSSWRSPDGRIGHLFVNIADTAQALKVNLDTRNTPAGKAYDAEIYRSTRGEAFQPLWQNMLLPKEFSAELAPLEVVFVELRDARTTPGKD